MKVAFNTLNTIPNFRSNSADFTINLGKPKKEDVAQELFSKLHIISKDIDTYDEGQLGRAASALYGLVDVKINGDEPLEKNRAAKVYKMLDELAGINLNKHLNLDITNKSFNTFGIVLLEARKIAREKIENYYHPKK